MRSPNVQPLLWLALLNMLLMLATPLAASGLAAVAHGVVTSNFRELDSNGAIDHDTVLRVWGPECSNWHRVVDRLVAAPLSSVYQAGFIVSGFFGLNAACLLVFWWRVRAQ